MMTHTSPDTSRAALREMLIRLRRKTRRQIQEFWREHHRGILWIPDFIANAGGVICAAVEYHGGTQSAAMETIEERIRGNTRAVLDAMPLRRVTSRQGGRRFGARTHRLRDELSTFLNLHLPFLNARTKRYVQSSGLTEGRRPARRRAA